MIEVKKLETKNILIDQKNNEGFMIYFTKYVHNKLINIRRLHYNELIGKIEEQEGKNI